MADITEKLGLNNLDSNRWYIEAKNRGFNIDHKNGNESFYGIKLVIYTEKFVKPVSEYYTSCFITAFNTAKERGINKNKESFAKNVKILYSNLVIYNIIGKKYDLNKLDKEIRDETVKGILSNFDKYGSDKEILKAFYNNYNNEFKKRENQKIQGYNINKGESTKELLKEADEILNEYKEGKKKNGTPKIISEEEIEQVKEEINQADINAKIEFIRSVTKNST